MTFMLKKKKKKIKNILSEVVFRKDDFEKYKNFVKNRNIQMSKKVMSVN